MYVSIRQFCCVILGVRATYTRSYLQDRAPVEYHAHPKEQTTVVHGSGLVAWELHTIETIVPIILGLRGGKKLSTKTRYRHSMSLHVQKASTMDEQVGSVATGHALAKLKRACCRWLMEERGTSTGRS